MNSSIWCSVNFLGYKIIIIYLAFLSTTQPLKKKNNKRDLLILREEKGENKYLGVRFHFLAYDRWPWLTLVGQNRQKNSLKECVFC